MYAKQNVIHLAAPIRRNDTSHLSQREEFNDGFKPTVIQVNDALTSQRESVCSSRSSSVERRPTELSISTHLLVSTRFDLGSKSSLVDSPHHGTPRSVKYRNKVNKLVVFLLKQICEHYLRGALLTIPMMLCAVVISYQLSLL
ncbi:hypothetical protein Tcan_11871 [Toxocara canis]|uniref:Uncharacterized protein n=1 Tax=Toxocara canis TaxID=6265 RepID=A0A0B2VUK0_TOXCA|nr:hypothetical protein Tcan_11871 [Toxocara canis]